MKNVYRIQRLDMSGYIPTSQERINRLIENEQAVWVGTDYDEDKDEFVHYADRVMS